MAYQRRYRLERRVILLADKYEQAVAHLEALDYLVPAGSPSRQAVPPVAPARAVLLPVPLTIGALSRWRCGHEFTLGTREAGIAQARGLVQVPCPVCGARGLLGHVIGGQVRPLLL